jgi:hypothetical protein
MDVINTIALLVERKEDDFEQDLYCCLFFHILRLLDDTSIGNFVGASGKCCILAWRPVLRYALA